MDGEPVYSDTFCRLNKEVLVKSDSLFSAQSSDVEEEANLCLALLMGYNATIYDDGDKEQKKQAHQFERNTIEQRLATAWKRGEIIFRSASWPEIIERISHYYGIEIDQETTKVPEERFRILQKGSRPRGQFRFLLSEQYELSSEFLSAHSL